MSVHLNADNLLWHCGHFHAMIEHFHILAGFYISTVLTCTDYIIGNLLSRKHLNRLQDWEETSQAGHRISLLHPCPWLWFHDYDFSVESWFHKTIWEFLHRSGYQHTQSFHTVLSRAFDYICSQLFKMVVFPKIPALPFSLPPECWSAAIAGSKAVPAMWGTLQSWAWV